MNNSSNTKRKLSDTEAASNKKVKIDHFFNAVESFSKDEIMNLINQGYYDSNARTYHGDTALHLAVDRGDLEIVDLLLQNGGKNTLYAQNNSRYTSLHKAVEKGDLEIVDLLLKSGSDEHIGARTDDGNTALHIAAFKDYLPISELLLKNDAGKYICAKSDNGYTALSTAAYKGKVAMANLLLNHGASKGVNIQIGSGHTALHLVLMNMVSAQNLMQGLSTEQEIQELEALALRLVEEGADINLPNECNRTPFYIGARSEYSQEFVLATLTHPNLDIHATNPSNQTPLHLAIESASCDPKLLAKYNCNITELVTQLIQKGANLEARDQDGQTPLFRAVWDGNEELVKLLIKSGADINIQSYTGESLLFVPEGCFGPEV